MPDQRPAISSDVTVIGGGLAGKAASLHLAKAGLKVICLEPERAARPPVGESLDWSAPDLLNRLGVSPESLLASRIATWKRHVTLKMRDGCEEHYIPSEWLGGPPFYVNLATLHVQRPQMDDEIFKLAIQAGVSFVHDRVVDIEAEKGSICSVQTESGARYSSPWFIDASGGGVSLIARKLGIPSLEYGPTKVAMWAYFEVPQQVEGTTLYMDPRPDEYLEWVWEIPVSPNTVSIGYIAPGTAIKEKRSHGASTEDIYHQQLAKFPHFGPLLQQEPPGDVHVTSFKCRVHTQSAGANWLIVGEAAAMVDPMTSNGVTASLRHGEEAAQLIIKYRNRTSLPWHRRRAYSNRIRQAARFFNEAIEKIIYEPAARNRMGLPVAGTAYTSSAWSMNVVYARMRAQGLFRTFILGLMFGFFRNSASLYYRYSN
jgi:menaquinone-9 beta-reductase